MLGGLKRASIIALFSLILLAPLLSAQVSWAITEAEVYMWTLLAIAICASFIGMAYMAAKFFELPQLEGWVKIEVSQLFTSMMIAVLCIVMIASVDAAAAFMTGAEAGGAIGAARNFLADPVHRDGRELYTKLGEAYFNLAKIASYTYTAGLSVGVASFSISASPASGASPLLADIGQAMDGVANFQLLALSQSAFLWFFKTASVVMLPVAIFLRSFSFTRKVGAVLLAAVIASSVIYPAGFLVAREIYNSYRLDLMESVNGIHVTPVPNPPAVSLVCSPFMQRFVASPLLGLVGGEMGWFLTLCSIPCLTGFLCEPCRWLVFSGFYIIKSAYPLIMYPILLGYAGDIGTASEIIGGYYDPLLRNALPAVAKYSVLSLMVFLIPLLIAMVMLRNLATAFGGEPQLYGLSRLV